MPPVFGGGRVHSEQQRAGEGGRGVRRPRAGGRPRRRRGRGHAHHPFATSHDAAASFGFRIEDAADGDAVGYLTDSGIVTAQAHAALRDVRILALESNHDPKMLAAGPYPYVIKQRIASNSGHSVQRPGGRRAQHAGGRIARAAGQRLPQTVVAARVAEQQRLQPGQAHASRRRSAKPAATQKPSAATKPASPPPANSRPTPRTLRGRSANCPAQPLPCSNASRCRASPPPAKTQKAVRPEGRTA